MSHKVAHQNSAKLNQSEDSSHIKIHDAEDDDVVIGSMHNGATEPIISNKDLIPKFHL